MACSAEQRLHEGGVERNGVGRQARDRHVPDDGRGHAGIGNRQLPVAGIAEQIDKLRRYPPVLYETVSVNAADTMVAWGGIGVDVELEQARSWSRGGCSLAVVTVASVVVSCSKTPSPSPSRAVPSASAKRVQATRLPSAERDLAAGAIDEVVQQQVDRLVAFDPRVVDGRQADAPRRPVDRTGREGQRLGREQVILRRAGTSRRALERVDDVHRHVLFQDSAAGISMVTLSVCPPSASAATLPGAANLTVGVVVGHVDRVAAGKEAGGRGGDRHRFRPHPPPRRRPRPVARSLTPDLRGSRPSRPPPPRRCRCSPDPRASRSLCPCCERRSRAWPRSLRSPPASPPRYRP